MKKLTWLSLLLALLLCLTFASCGRDEIETPETSEVSETESESAKESGQTEAPKPDDGGDEDDQTPGDGKDEDDLWNDAITTDPTGDYDNDGNWTENY